MISSAEFRVQLHKIKTSTCNCYIPPTSLKFRPRFNLCPFHFSLNSNLVSVGKGNSSGFMFFFCQGYTEIVLWVKYFVTCTGRFVMVATFPIYMLPSNSVSQFNALKMYNLHQISLKYTGLI